MMRKKGSNEKQDDGRTGREKENGRFGLHIARHI